MVTEAAEEPKIKIELRCQDELEIPPPRPAPIKRPVQEAGPSGRPSKASRKALPHRTQRRVPPTPRQVVPRNYHNPLPGTIVASTPALSMATHVTIINQENYGPGYVVQYRDAHIFVPFSMIPSLPEPGQDVHVQAARQAAVVQTLAPGRHAETQVRDSRAPPVHVASAQARDP